MTRLVREGGGLTEVLQLPDGRGVHTERGKPFEVKDVSEALIAGLIASGHYKAAPAAPEVAAEESKAPRKPKTPREE